MTKNRELTDEEKAIVYTDNIHIEYNEILSRSEVVDEIRKAYIAGLKAGRESAYGIIQAYQQGAEFGYNRAYITGAEPREKRIAELEKENAELKEQIEKMKCCENCHTQAGRL